MIVSTIPGAKIWGPKAGDSWDKQLCRFLFSPRLSLGWRWGWGNCRGAVLFLWRWLRGALPVDATAEVWWTAVSQGVELPEFISQEVPQGCTANRAAEVRQKEVATGAGCWREMEGVVRVIPLCFHNGGEPWFLQNSRYKVYTFSVKC